MREDERDREKGRGEAGHGGYLLVRWCSDEDGGDGVRWRRAREELMLLDERRLGRWAEEAVDWAAAKIKGGGRIEFGSGGDPEVGGGVAAVTRRMGQIS